MKQRVSSARHYGVLQWGLLIGALCLIGGYRFGFFLVTPPDWLLVGIACVAFALAPLGMAQMLYQKRQEIAALQAEAFQIPFVPQIIAEAVLEHEHAVVHQHALHEEEDTAMQCCPECLAVIRLFQSRDPACIPAKKSLADIPAHIAPHRCSRLAPWQQSDAQGRRQQGTRRQGVSRA